MKILITGASGFIGGRIASYLFEKGHDVVASGRTQPKNESSFNSKMNWKLGSLNDKTFCDQLISRYIALGGKLTNLRNNWKTY